MNQQYEFKCLTLSVDCSIFPQFMHLLQANIIVWQYLAFDVLAMDFTTSIFILWIFELLEHENILLEVQNKYFKSQISTGR